MVANIEKIKTCCHAVGSFVVNVLTLKFPLWLFIAVFLAAVLLFSAISCTRDKAITQAVVGKTEYNGHSYMVFGSVLDNRTIAVVHDPDCVCHFVESVDVVE